MNSYESAALFEHRFWLQVLGDHARFIFSALAPSEQEDIQRATYFITTFDQLLEQSRRSLSANELMVLNQQAYQQAEAIREFKLNLIQKHLIGKIELDLPPTFINHMVNEVEEYLRILTALLAGQVPPSQNPVCYHLLWLLDAEGHAAGLASDLDSVERDLIERAKAFMVQFDDYYTKAVEMAGYQRTCLSEFPALSRFNRQVETTILMFKEYLRNLEGLVASNQALGTLTPLIPDHMAREECYYLIKLAEVSEVKKPDCDPTRPRVQS